MTDKEIIDLVRQMRAAQRKYVEPGTDKKAAKEEVVTEDKPF